jgi:hypothetical protein
VVPHLDRELMHLHREAVDLRQQLAILLQQRELGLTQLLAVAGIRLRERLVALRLTGLRQQDQRRRVGRLHREQQIQQDVRVRVEVDEQFVAVEEDPGDHQQRLADEVLGGAEEACNAFGKRPEAATAERAAVLLVGCLMMLADHHRLLVFRRGHAAGPRVASLCAGPCNQRVRYSTHVTATNRPVVMANAMADSHARGWRSDQRRIGPTPYSTGDRRPRLRAAPTIASGRRQQRFSRRMLTQG